MSNFKIGDIVYLNMYNPDQKYIIEDVYIVGGKNVVVKIRNLDDNTITFVTNISNLITLDEFRDNRLDILLSQ